MKTILTALNDLKSKAEDNLHTAANFLDMNYWKGRIAAYEESRQIVSSFESQSKRSFSDQAEYKEALPDGVYGLKKGGTLVRASDVRTEDAALYECAVVKKGFTCVKVSLTYEAGQHNFEDAQKVAASRGSGWRCPTRHEAMDVYDARFEGLDELLKTLNGEPLDKYVWTCEQDTDPQSSAQNAWLVFFHNSRVHTYPKSYTHSVRAFSAYS